MTLTAHVTRPIDLDDAPALVDVLHANRAFLAPWEPVRDESYFTLEGQREVVRHALEAQGAGLGRAHVIVHDGRVVGRATLAGVVRGALQSCALSYWVAAEHNGRGLATASVGELLDVAFTELGLHRVQAETLPHNAASQRVLARNGFVRYGLAPRYLRIAGAWQDHVMHQVLNPAADG
ncbi:GNAT family N-acetyltransferase [Cellulomonas chengniuliangii]|uniref:GNAT family N-acetyltransferase n=1 Tax=Cellulomonas chengniuliangii TaxID=2968084 RepID=UPI001D0E537B|nr:GNAT family protein [Cellulomonas chengniuliangii]MCC2319115.1 GNAT family N-acetyltransferase [Cellulomonas chengniuliangii]